MKKLNIDLGIEEFQLGAGVLRFNPRDPNLYARFMDSQAKIEEVEKELVEKGKTLPEDATAEETGRLVLAIMAEADAKTKALLNEVFGHGNDFNTLLEGVNVMAVGANDERVITNILMALLPIIEEGAAKAADEKVGAAVNMAKANRAQRRAAAKARK